MSVLTRLLTFAAIAVTVASGASLSITPPAFAGVKTTIHPPAPEELDGETTDVKTIISEAVEQEVPEAVIENARVAAAPEGVPDGYELVFGPINGANNAPGYMGFTFLDEYGIDACARECNRRGADGNGGACQYFNIWRANVSGVPTTTTCTMYFIVADASSAVNTGQGDLQVTNSRGYKRKNLIVDGGFEAYNECDDFCFTESYRHWRASSPPGGYLDASIFYFPEYAHSGSASALLGSATFADDKSGTLRPNQPLRTEAGKKYQVAFFQNSAFSGPSLQAKSIVEVIWNGKVVSTIKPGFSQWTFHSVDVDAVGNDILEFRGGAAPAWTFIDDIAVWPMFQ